MPKKSLTYAQAVAEIEKIVAEMDTAAFDVDSLSRKIKEANELIAFCTAKLNNADAEIEKLLSEKRETKE